MSDVIIVSGFGRCGSSLLMQMLHAGGFPCVGRFPAFEERECDPTLLRRDWLSAQHGKALKVLDPQRAAPGMFDGIPRRIIWIDRDPKQQAKSFVKFGRLVAGMPFNRSHVKALVRSFKSDLPKAMRALQVADCRLYSTTFEICIGNSASIAISLKHFLEFPEFNVYSAARVVRKRSSDCLPYMLEAELIRPEFEKELRS